MSSIQPNRLNHFRPTQAGFTLIELIMVIVILGILAAVAVPKFTDLSAEAEKAAADGVYTAAQSAAAMNFAAMRAGKAGTVMITNVTQLLAAMDGVPDGWAGLTHTGKDGVTYTITVTTAESATAKAVLGKSW